MKLVRCEWAPSLVVEWLCGELEERGIPGPTYAHTLLSLLHHHYCPHPAPATPNGPSRTSSVTAPCPAGPRYFPPLSRRLLDDFDLRDLDLDDLLDHTTHPDADLPDLSAITQQQRGGSRRARKRHKVRQKHRILTSEQLQKVAALQCLMSASDERYDLESLVEELCSRLKTAAENDHLNASNKVPACITSKSVSLNSVSQESSNDTEEYTSSSTPEEQAERYYAAFPPLSGSSKVKCSHEKAWKSGDAFCSCVWECRKPLSVPHSEGIPGTNTVKMPRTYRKKHREKSKKEVEAKQEPVQSHEEPQRHPVSFTWHSSSKHKEAQLNEFYDTDSASEPERSSERRRKKFVGPLLDEDIGEGYIGDTSSRESSEDRDKGEQDSEKPREEKGDRNQGHSGESKEKGNQEEWECMGDLVLEGSNQGGEGMLGIGGNRLFERGSTSGGTSGSSSDVETQEAKSVRQLERKISNTVAQVWGQAGELLGHGRGEHVWDPPAPQEPALYTTVWGFSLPKQQLHQNLQESSPPHPQHSLSSQSIQEPLTPTLNGWDQSCSWHPSNCLAEESSLVCSISSQSPFSSLKESLTRDPSTHLGIQNNFEKSIWSDCNANDITDSENVLPVCLEKHHISNDGDKERDEGKNHTFNDDLEKKLLESFVQLSLENLWENTLGLENVFTDISISNSNLDCVSENKNLETAAHSSHTDSEHEKMMALVEGVCNSDESQEEESLDSSSKDLPSGPIGPHAVLHHTENSGFSMVVPRGKSAESSPAIDQRPETLLVGPVCSVGDDGGGGGGAMMCTGVVEGMDSLPPAQEEENLLTSPRTHFRPIRQDSIGSITDDHYEDGTMFVVNSERPDLPFQRTSSGALFLESDILEGSPKKYMVYKEPVPRVTQGEEEQPQVTREKLTAIALVPKFKVINNEKFCQTEEDGLQGVGGKSCYKIKMEKIALNNNNHYAIRDDGKEPDVFEFQQQDFPDNATLANIWKNRVGNDSRSQLKSIWQIQREEDNRNAWPIMSDMKQGVVWLDKEGEGATGWSSEGCFEPPLQPERSNKTEAVVIPTSLASLWHQNSSPESPTVPSMPSLQDLWASFKPSIIEDSEHEGTGGQKYIITNPTTHIPGKYNSEAGANLSSMVESGPWSVRTAEEVSGHARKDKIWSEQHLLSSSQQHLHVGDQKRITSLGGAVEAPGACTELRLEVDQEADELLGAVHAHTNFSQGQMGGPQGGTYSPRPLHERLRKNSASIKKGEQKDDVEQEDLADLAPDWELNDGFEWGLQASGALEGEDAAGDEDECEGEVLIYENDGVTYTIPVEYLDDSLYDQIFGASDASSHRLGGSLPDLPSGHPSSIFFSSELEDKWKRSGVPYKVQLPRKSRPGRWLPPSRRPCTFFMEGSCRRSDCKFSHDLASITCRFWEEGSCLKGITCPFLHGYPLRRRRNKSEGAAHSEGDRADPHSSSFEIDSEMDFPTLGSSCDSKASSTDDRGGLITNYHAAAAAAARKKKRKFITITKNVLGEMKGLEAEKTLHRIPRRDRRRRHTDIIATNLHDTTSTTTNTATAAAAAATTAINTEPSHSHHSTRKAKRHRASASGHDDGTVSDY
ncbi:uncharacterized protein LOC127009028 isoform X1 [Eriocheir sinensis]|uniref:uncharacterized protein LOC127009028 isoform X1 n=1 Tax=Eriocheir sinensis TaxID=95602 RepID=UPI0021C94F7C|nr:uncharacterized protein LOC127009028 isoform X1 [Eriocheir sinensis]XP_050737589.1 uncharacterized protein LOC127009028 isoform X1 [Eriocheir sinensis]XP_050737590.1 uncharacterized protein LOC127009028 isoform X1 [Eriocheir sinensis]XP_050737591.1 uncharacterized protein LOC127009028 isoform X1 [Eriocheir sinensis]